MSPTTRRVAARATALVALTALLAACGSIKEDVEERVTREVLDTALGEEVDLREDGFTIEDEDGRKIGIGTDELPDAWPSDLPVPSGGHISSSIVDEGADRTEIAALIGFEGDRDEVRATIEEALAGSTWTPDGDASTMEAEGVRAWGRTYRSGERTTKVSVVDNGESTQVSWQVDIPAGS